MRLINTDNLDVVGFESNDMSDEYKKGFCDGVLKMGEVIDNTPTIDTESLPEVIAMKQYIAELTAERDALKREIREASLCYMCKNNGVICHKSNPKTDPEIMCGSFKWRGKQS